MNATLLNEYRRTRQLYPSAGPHYALRRAREAIARGASTAVGYVSFLPSSSALAAPFNVGRSICRWAERPEDIGLRLVGHADEIGGFGHCGWYLEDEGAYVSGETARGVVLQLPARAGKALYVPGVADPYNNGPAVVCLDDATEDQSDAARWADRLAEIYAEDARDYQRAANARFRFDELAEQVKDERRAAIQLLADRRAARNADVPADVLARLCKHIAGAVETCRRCIREARAERAKLESDFGSDKGWADA